MTRITVADLQTWNDPDDLLRALGQIGDEQKHELRDAVARLLEHHDPDVREEAMRRLLVNWKERQWRSRALDALQHDEAREVRTVAAYAVATTSTDATRAEDVDTLIRVLEAEDNDGFVRAAAYDALLILERRPDFPSRKRQFDPARDVNWEWVESLRSRSQE